MLGGEGDRQGHAVRLQTLRTLLSWAGPPLPFRPPSPVHSLYNVYICACGSLSTQCFFYFAGFIAPVVAPKLGILKRCLSAQIRCQKLDTFTIRVEQYGLPN